MHTTISYTDCIAGKYSGIKGADPIGQYFAARGARMLPGNVFHDQSLTFGDNAIKNLIHIIRSGRRQKFENLDICIPKSIITYYLKVARQLMALEQVVIEASEENDDVIFKTYYPERIWLESAYLGARSRTVLHPKHMSDIELEQIKRACSLPDRQAGDIKLLLKALELDEELFVK